MSAPLSPRVVGLDLSLTRTGIALPDGTARVLRSPFDAKHPHDRLQWIREEVLGEALWPSTETPASAATNTGSTIVDLVAMEGYAYARVNQAHQLGELGGVVRVALHEAGIRFVVIPPAVLKRYATGKGNAKKEQVLVAAVKRLDYDGADDNEADALWLRALAMDRYGHPVCTVPKAQREGSIAAVDWPRLGVAA